MKTNSKWILAFLSSSLLVVTFLLWMLLAPSKLGGKVEYIFITGNSMEPHITEGDLIIVRNMEHYSIRDAVAYNNAELNKVVFHRIVGGNANHYLMQGDNNDWPDSYQPSSSEILGAQWFDIPKGGLVVQWIRKPLVASLIVGLIGVIVMVNLINKKRPKKNSEVIDQSTSPETIPGASRQAEKIVSPAFKKRIPGDAGKIPSLKNQSESSFLVEVGFFVLGFFTIFSIVILIIGFSKPVTSEITLESPYTQSGTYQYNAPSSEGVYEANAISSGDPIFTKLTCRINLDFSYQITGSDLENLSGSHQINAVLLEPVSGWKRVFPLEKSQSFTGDHFSQIVVVDLCQMQSEISAMETLTGTNSFAYTVLVSPNVVINGKISGVDFQASFNEALPFQLDDTRAFVIQEVEGSDPLHPSLGGVQQSTGIETNKVNFFKLKIPVANVRIISLCILAVSLLGLLFLIFTISKASRQDKLRFIGLKYGSSMVDVENSFDLGSRKLIKVKNIDDLARIAEKLGSVILHYEENGQHLYNIETNNMVYQWLMDEPAKKEIYSL